ncbi:hypothetical protein NQ315_017280 [Exocentrus adspersus]|uniref:Uncharacterized protein n=1 Tax=Exocentrus adspersus TaxID=1586481 RepID=A0AAV8V8Q1_9CUCU|nr:hypothetical protein NQ315_017280 [Exocentrus adspersus]
MNFKRKLAIQNITEEFLKEPLISWEAHFVGGIAGLLLGLVLFKSDETDGKPQRTNKFLFWIGLSLFFALMISFVILTLQIKKCTPPNTIHVRYVYFC